MRTLGLVLVLVLAVAGASFAETANVDIYSGWNVIACPLVPMDSQPTSVFNGFDLEFTVALMRFDAVSQAQIVYNPYDTSEFGGMLLGDGYTVWNDTTTTLSYEGIADGVPSAGLKTDMWISLPGDQNDGQDAGGWQLIGQPFNHDTPIDNGSNTGNYIMFTDGTQMLNWSQAVDAGWVADSALYFDGDTQAQYSAGYFFNDDDTFRAGKGYWIQTLKDNLAMIIPGN